MKMRKKPTKTEPKPWRIDNIPSSANELVRRAYEAGYKSNDDTCSVNIAAAFLMERGHTVDYGVDV